MKVCSFYFREPSLINLIQKLTAVLFLLLNIFSSFVFSVFDYDFYATDILDPFYIILVLFVKMSFKTDAA